MTMIQNFLIKIKTYFIGDEDFRGVGGRLFRFRDGRSGRQDHPVIPKDPEI